MDKFGIFNLLGSLFKYYTSSYSADNGIKKDMIKPNFNADNNEKPEKNPDKQKPHSKNDALFNTMKSHDEFVKRVSEKSTPTKTKSQG